MNLNGDLVSSFKHEQEMVNALEQFRLEHSKDRRGRHTLLTFQEQVLVALEKGREYRTYFHIGTNWGVSESTICRIVIA